MVKEKINKQFIGIIIIIAVAFAGSSLLFVSMYVESLRSYSKSNLALSVFQIKSDIESDKLPNTDLYKSESITYWLFDNDGNITLTNDPNDAENIFSLSDFSQITAADLKEADEIKYLSINDTDNPFYTTGVCLGIIRLSDADHYLAVKNSGKYAREAESRQLVLILFIEILLLFVVIILVSNICTGLCPLHLAVLHTHITTPSVSF